MKNPQSAIRNPKSRRCKPGERMPDKTLRKKLLAIYGALYKAYGPQHWWPGETPFEVMVGAVLTQNTAWANVEKAITNLKRHDLLTPSRLSAVTLKRLALLIRPSGYFNVKAKRLKHLVSFITREYGGSLGRLFAEGPAELRRKLLEVHGIGPETADSILLYAAKKPFFVVDAYTKRVFGRHGLVVENAGYHDVQGLVMENLPRSGRLFNEYHALIVRVAKERCKRRGPLCLGCPLEGFLPGRP
jgi:endonuclease-3 related protein